MQRGQVKQRESLTRLGAKEKGRGAQLSPWRLALGASVEGSGSGSRRDPASAVCMSDGRLCLTLPSAEEQECFQHREAQPEAGNSTNERRILSRCPNWDLNRSV